MDFNSEVCGLLIFALEVWQAVKASIFNTVNKLYSLAYKFNRPFSYRQKKTWICQRGNRAKKRGCLGGRIITPRNVGKNLQILRKPLRFAFLTTFGCK